MGIKDVFSKAKTKVNEIVEKGNSSLTKLNNTKSVTFYSSPIVGGFIIKKAFYEEKKLLFPKENFNKNDIKKNAIIGLNDDLEYYVITWISEDTIIKEVEVNHKKYTYECYEVTYGILNDEFTNEVTGVPYTELTENQFEIMREIKTKIEAKSLAMKGKKEFCLNMWQYVIECIEYQLKDHYILICFAKIANEYIDDFSTYLIRLFA
ncbi:MAG: hypothetical protein K2I42_05265 [Anaeroplasmataceae bacterium]|nr:hypothetical protein [Anaeroplasmataceae bacterium]